MDNQYSYYTPNQEEPDTNMQVQGNHPSPKRERKGAPKWTKFLCYGLVFGISASVIFQAGNVVGDRWFGTLSGQKEAKQVATIEDAKLSTNTNSTVTSDVAKIVKNAMPSVVSITNMSIQQVQSFFGSIQERPIESAGSGIIVSQNDNELLIVTNNHVVEGSNTLTVSFVDGESVEANIKGTDASKDLAVIAVSLSSIKNDTMEKIAVANMGDSAKLQVGEPAIAIGNALGYGQSVTTGIISATNRQLDTYDGELIQTDAAINPGNSGGALLNASGEVIGINSIKVATDTVEGMGYAIPITDASEIITGLMNKETKEKVDEKNRGTLGIEAISVTSDSSQMYNMPIGVYISEIVSDGGADKAGLAKGSIITALNGDKIDSKETLVEQMQYYSVGEKVELTVQIPQKNGEYREQLVEVTLGAANK